MATELTKGQWIEILRDPSIVKPYNLEIFQYLYSCDGHTGYASDIGRHLGIGGVRPAIPVNLRIGELAKRIVKKQPVEFTRKSSGKDKYWDFFFNGREEDNGKFAWQLKPNLIAALEEAGLTGEIKIPEEVPEKLFEGAKRTVTVNAYERNPMARARCIKFHGAVCKVCGFDFYRTYGSLGQGFINVHHLTSLSEIGENYEVNPIEYLRPVCPNCHAMLHKGNLTIEELKKLIDK